MGKHTCLAGLLMPLLFILFATPEAAAQTVPRDTTYQKPSLPTGPPVPVSPAPQPTQPVKERPVIVSPPQVIIPDTVRKEDNREVKENAKFVDKLYYGGSFGLQFGTYTNISLLPTVTYRLTDKLGIGVGGVYHFIREGDISLNNYGGRALLQAETFEIGDGAILLHAEVEMLSLEYLSAFNAGFYETSRKSIALPMLGIGYRQRIGEKASFDLLLLYNVNEDRLNPYSNPVFRASFNLPFKR